MPVIKTICFLIVVVTLGSCSKYQYATIDSALQKDLQSRFVFDNDTVKIIFSFSGKDGPLQFIIYNKLQKPVYVDWAKSSFIKDEHIFPFWHDVTSLSVESREYYIPWFIPKTTSSGVLYKPQQVTFIPPQTKIERKMNFVNMKYLKLSDTLQTRTVLLPTFAGSAKGQRASFQKDSSPIRFRCLLTISTHDNLSSPFYVDVPFWVGDITNTMVAPNELQDKRSNLFYVEENTALGKGFLVVFGTVALLALLLIYVPFGK